MQTFWFGVTSTSGIIVHPNNSLVILEDFLPGGIYLFCASGSMKQFENVGQLIGLDGIDITFVDDDLIFYYNKGPGYRTFSLDYKFTDQGVYTCRIPDENDVEVDVSIGIYPQGFNGEFHCTCSGY